MKLNARFKWHAQRDSNPCFRRERMGDVVPDPDDTDFGLLFDGKGYREGKEMLQELRRKRPDVHQEFVTVIAGYGW